MRKVFVSCKTKRQAKKQCPWAVVIMATLGGFWCFEDWKDYYEWGHK